jgi:hypothetical protein
MTTDEFQQALRHIETPEPSPELRQRCYATIPHANDEYRVRWFWSVLQGKERGKTMISRAGLIGTTALIAATCGIAFVWQSRQHPTPQQSTKPATTRELIEGDLFLDLQEVPYHQAINTVQFDPTFSKMVRGESDTMQTVEWCDRERGYRIRHEYHQHDLPSKTGFHFRYESLVRGNIEYCWYLNDWGKIRYRTQEFSNLVKIWGNRKTNSSLDRSLMERGRSLPIERSALTISRDTAQPEEADDQTYIIEGDLRRDIVAKDTLLQDSVLQLTIQIRNKRPHFEQLALYWKNQPERKKVIVSHITFWYNPIPDSIFDVETFRKSDPTKVNPLLHPTGKP